MRLLKKALLLLLSVVMVMSFAASCKKAPADDIAIKYTETFPEDFIQDYLIKSKSGYLYDEQNYSKRAMFMANKINDMFNQPQNTAPSRLTWRTGYYTERMNEPNQWAYGALQTMALSNYIANPDSQEAKTLLIDVSEQIELFKIRTRTHATLDFSLTTKGLDGNYMSDEMIDLIAWMFDLKDGANQARVAVYSATPGAIDPYYDDNVWTLMALLETGIVLDEAKYIERAELNMGYIVSGWNFNAGGGITWKEGTPSKNTCINGPAIMASTMFYDYYNSDRFKGDEQVRAKKKAFYLGFAEAVYKWTTDNLRDSVDGTYYDNVKWGYGGGISAREEYKLAYNTGTMISAGARLYRIHKDLDNEELANQYKSDSLKSAAGSYIEFVTRNRAFVPDLDIFPEFAWFSVYLVKGYLDVYEILGDGRYMERVQNTMDYAWKNARDYYGFIKDDWTGRTNTPTVNYMSVELIKVSASAEVMAMCGIYENMLKVNKT